MNKRIKKKLDKRNGFLHYRDFRFDAWINAVSHKYPQIEGPSLIMISMDRRGSCKHPRIYILKHIMHVTMNDSHAQTNSYMSLNIEFKVTQEAYNNWLKGVDTSGRTI